MVTSIFYFSHNVFYRILIQLGTVWYRVNMSYARSSYLDVKTNVREISWLKDNKKCFVTEVMCLN